MLKISRLLHKIPAQNRVTPKTVTIVHKNGRDVIKDEFVGFYVQRPNIVEVINNFFENLFPFQK